MSQHTEVNMEIVHNNPGIRNERTRMFTVGTPRFSKRAIGFRSTRGNYVWVPKSQCQVVKNGNIYSLTVTEWWCGLNEDQVIKL